MICMDRFGAYSDGPEFEDVDLAERLAMIDDLNSEISLMEINDENDLKEVTARAEEIQKIVDENCLEEVDTDKMWEFISKEKRRLEGLLCEEQDEGDYYYIPSATRGDYSPTCPWKAPGMSIRDFI